MKPNANEGSGRIPTGKGKPKAKSYGWGDGKGRIHSIPKGQHVKNVAKRRENIRRNDPAAFTQPRSLNDVTRDAGTSADLRYGGQERALGLQAQQVPAWFAQYRAQVQGINQGIQQGYQKAIGDVTAQAQQTAASDTNARNTLASTMQNDAASRGATVDPKLLGNDVNAANVRNTNQAAFANLLGAQGQAQNSYFGGLQTAGSAAELGQKTRISQEQAGVATDKGLYKSQYVTDAKDTERKYGLEKAAFGLDVDKAQADVNTKTRKINSDARTARAKRRADAKAKGQTVNKFGYTNEQWARFSPSHRQRIQKQLGPSGTGVKPAAPKAKDKNGLTPNERVKQREKQTNAVTRIETATERYSQAKRTPFPKGDPRFGKPITPADVYGALVGSGEGKFSKVEVDLARDRLRNGGRLSARGMRVARAHGIKVPKEWRPLRNKTERGIDKNKLAGPPAPR